MRLATGDAGFWRTSGRVKAHGVGLESDEAYRCMEEDAYEVAAKYMKVKELIQKKEYYKGKDGKIDMCKAMQDWSEEERAAGRAEGQVEELRNIVLNMVMLKVGDEDIIRFTGCSMELITQVRNELKRKG